MSNKLYTQIVPEKPSILAEERVFVYVPKVTSNAAGIAKFLPEQFTVINGQVSIKLIYETKIDANIHKLRTTAVEGRLNIAEPKIVQAEADIVALETFRDTTVPATYETIADANTHRARTTVLEADVAAIESGATVIPTLIKRKQGYCFSSYTNRYSIPK